ncbi:MAG: hypothetical protein R3320_05520 [Nitriliruptorales bacterium]|nr:hypothetical protein [Nitriliruptorales bacterium]
MPEREWVSIRDPDDDHLRYTFDVSFLLSDYTCIYGAGCRGIRSDGVDEQIGCCLHGAYLTEDWERDALERATAEHLTPELMEHHALASEGGIFEDDDEGETHTRLVGDACIFLNSADFPGGMGCAFHHLALARDEHHMTYKPIVCWQLPLHRTISEEVGNDGETLVTHTIAAYERGTWGDGGADFHWWCTEDPAAFVNERAVYRSMENELREMVGDPVYEELREFLDSRSRQRNRVRFLPIAGA